MRHALFCLVVWPAVTRAVPRIAIRLNSSSSSSSSSVFTSPEPAFLPTPLLDPASNLTTLPTSTMTSEPSALTTTFTSSLSDLSNEDSTITSSSDTTASSQVVANSTTSAASNSSTPGSTICTGCVLQAIRPSTITYEPTRTIWEDIKVTVSVVNSTITYMVGSSIDTIVTEYETITQKLDIPANQTVVSTTPVFTWVPLDGTTVTFKVGPTYVAYTDIYGGLDFPSFDPTDAELSERGPIETDIPTLTADGPLPTTPFTSDGFELNKPEPTCEAQLDLIPIQPTESSDYNFYIQTFEGPAPSAGSPDMPVSLPAPLIEYLKTNPTITSIFNGSDIATCTVRATTEPTLSFTSFTDIVPTTPVGSVPPMFSPTTRTFLSKTFESTTTHVTVQGCLRCSKPPTPSKGTPEEPDRSNQVIAPPTRRPEPPLPPPKSVERPPPNSPNQVPNNPVTPDRPPPATANPPLRPNDRGQSITIGDGVVNVRPAQPTNPGQQNDPNREQPLPQNPGVVINSQTLTPGQTTSINGVQVIVPTDNSGANRNIIVDGSTIAVIPAPTGPPVLTVGDSTLTANSQGQFVVGTQTLTPGGSPITVDGTTLSLGPSGTIAVVNGATQTIANAPLLPTDAGPALTANGQIVTPTVVDGTTQFILGPGQTLTPGGVLTVDGTTFSLPDAASGSLVVVVNGETSTLAGDDDARITAAPALTIDGQTFPATVRDGTTEYVLGDGTTLRPGEAVTIDGTTYSLDPDGTALVLDGTTSSLPSGPATNPARTTTGSVRDPGDFIASGIDISSKARGVLSARPPGIDTWIEGVVIAVAGWLVLLL